MADNKVVNATQLEADLTSIADAIRAKAQSSDSLAFPNGFAEAIANIGDLSYLVNETITLADSIPGGTSQVLFQSDKLKNLTDYTEMAIERTTVSNLGVTAIFYKKNINGTFSMCVHSGTWKTRSDGGSPSLTIDENGNVTVNSGRYYIYEGEYRLYVIGK